MGVTPASKALAFQRGFLEEAEPQPEVEHRPFDLSPSGSANYIWPGQLFLRLYLWKMLLNFYSSPFEVLIVV